MGVVLPFKLPEFMLNPIGYVRALELRYLELHYLKLRSEEPAKPGFQLVNDIVCVYHIALSSQFCSIGIFTQSRF